MRKLTYLIATSIDGLIADSSGATDMFPLEPKAMADLAADYPESFPAHIRSYFGIPADAPNRHFDTVLMGYGTYEPALKHGITSPYPHLRQIVFSSRLREHDPAVEVVDDDAVAFVARLKAAPGTGIWLCGGGKLASALADHIDELVIKLNPIVLGAGIPVFGAALPPTNWRLVGEMAYDSGYRRLRYVRAGSAETSS